MDTVTSKFWFIDIFDSLSSVMQTQLVLLQTYKERLQQYEA